MNTQSHSIPGLKLITTLLIIAVMLSACAPSAITKAPPQPTATGESVAATQPVAPTEAPTEVIIVASLTPASSGLYTLESSAMATNIQEETIAAAASDDAPAREVLPAYTRLTLQGYPISNHVMQPQIFIYPVKELEQANQDAGKVVASLQSLIESPHEIAHMPFLPLVNSSQVMHAHLQYLDFKNGHGLRYLAQFDQGMTPINNHELIYTYQGLTSDGKYYVAAILPVTHPSLPGGETVTGNEPAEFTSDFPAYLAKVTGALNEQAPDTFTPDLTRLDAMFSSLVIQ